MRGIPHNVPCGKTFPFGTSRFDLVILTLVFDLLIENFTFGYLLNVMYYNLDISRDGTLSQVLFMGTNRSDLVTLTLVFYILIENINLAYIF